MKAVILCGGKGTRIAEETSVIPKPMVKIGDKPILWHIMKSFSSFGIDDFILAAGYKGQVIKDNIKTFKEFGKVEILDTGENTMTGGRILRTKKFLAKEEKFMMTYGDGLSDINLKKLLSFHNSHKKIATVTAVHPPVRFGELNLKNDIVETFEEKPQAKAGWINGGFFILNNKIFDYIKNDNTIFEREPLVTLCKEQQLMAYKHEKFWHCMDTLRDKIVLNKMFNNKNTPWLK
jgi:glucose-1-phosphate cytidylyltransferase